MKVQTSSIVTTTVFGLVLFSGIAVASTAQEGTWAKQAYSDPCMNGDVPADGIVRLEDISAYASI